MNKLILLISGLLLAGCGDPVVSSIELTTPVYYEANNDCLSTMMPMATIAHDGNGGVTVQTIMTPIYGTERVMVRSVNVREVHKSGLVTFGTYKSITKTLSGCN